MNEMNELKVKVYAEDEALEAFIKEFTKKFFSNVKFSSGGEFGGKGKALSRLKDFINSLNSLYPISEWDALIVGIDADNINFRDQKKEIINIIDNANFSLPFGWAIAVPMPHVEAWFFLDIKSLSNVLECSIDFIYKKIDSFERSGSVSNFKDLFEDILNDLDTIDRSFSSYAGLIAYNFDLNILNDEPIFRFLDNAHRSLKSFKNELETIFHKYKAYYEKKIKRI